MNKKVLYGILLFFVVVNIQAQKRDHSFCLTSNNVIIPIYKNRISYKPFGTIMNDTISDLYPIITPIKQSSSRFYAKIEYGTLSLEDIPYIYGWIEKKYCGVYMCLLHEMKNYALLYKKPNEMSACIQLTEVPFSPVIVLDYKGEWLKVKFSLNGIQYVGWTKDYGENFFCPCGG